MSLPPMQASLEKSDSLEFSYRDIHHMRGEEESYNVRQSAERLDLQKNIFESGSIVARISRGISSLDFEKN